MNARARLYAVGMSAPRTSATRPWPPASVIVSPRGEPRNLDVGCGRNSMLPGCRPENCTTKRSYPGWLPVRTAAIAATAGAPVADSAEALHWNGVTLAAGAAALSSAWLGVGDAAGGWATGGRGALGGTRERGPPA